MFPDGNNKTGNFLRSNTANNTYVKTLPLDGTIISETIAKINALQDVVSEYKARIQSVLPDPLSLDSNIKSEPELITRTKISKLQNQ